MPSCSGTAKFMRPTTNGIAMKKIMMVPCAKEKVGYGNVRAADSPVRTAGRDRLLRAHHDRVAEAAQQHDERQYAIHDADPLVVDRGEPFAPQVRARLTLHRRMNPKIATTTRTMNAVAPMMMG